MPLCSCDARPVLTHWGRMTHICVWPALSHYLNQCWIIVNWNLKNKLQWNIKQNLCIFIQENAFENVVCKMAATLLWPQCVNSVEVSKSYLPKDVWKALHCPYFKIVFGLKAFITHIHVRKNWWNSMNWWSGHMAVQQTVELPVIWDAMELMWPHYNGMNSKNNIS